MFFIIMVREGRAFIKTFSRLVGELGPVYIKVGNPLTGGATLLFM